MKYRVLITALLIAAAVFTSALGEAIYNVNETVSTEYELFCPSADKSGLIRFQATVSRGVTEAPERALVNMLLDPGYDGALPAAGEGAFLTYSETACGIVYVNIETQTVTDARDKALCVFAVWRTLQHNLGFKGVNVFINGVCTSWNGYSLNTLSAVTDDKLDFASLAQNAYQTRMYTLYCPDESGAYIVPVLAKPQNRLIQLYETAQEFDALLHPEYVSDAFYGADFAYTIDDSGARNLEIRLAEYNQADSRLLCTSFFAYAMTAFTCEADVRYAKLIIDGRPVQVLTGSDGRTIVLADGKVRRNTLSAYIGSILTEYSGGIAASKLINAADANDPVSIIYKCCRGIAQGDLNGGYIENGCAYIDMTEAFYNASQAFSADEERKLIYGMVNSVCFNTSASCVWFFVEGKAVSSLAASLPLDRELYPDYTLTEDVQNVKNLGDY